MKSHAGAFGRIRWHISVLFIFCYGVLVSSAFAQGFNRIVIFGDSLSDPGNHFILFGTSSRQPFAPIPSASYDIGGHHFSNGATWAEQLAMAVGMPTSGHPATRVPGVFTNYAIGRARARVCTDVVAACPSGQYPEGEVDLRFELDRFQSDIGSQLSASDLVVMWIGANDIDDALNALVIDNTGQTSSTIIGAAVTAEANGIARLYSDGARTFFVPTLPNLAVTPFVRLLAQNDPQIETIAAEFSAGYNAGLDKALAALAALPGISFVRLDVGALFAQVQSSPATFGFANAQDSCLTFGVIGGAICSTPNRYLFWDGLHPTAAGHAVIARAALQALPAATGSPD